jgi:hypothetical protein
MLASSHLDGQNCAAAPTPPGPPARPATSGRDPTQDADWRRLLTHLPSDWAATAQATHALQRRRAIRSVEDLLRLVLVYALWDWSLNLVGAWATTLGLAHLSDVAVLKRLRGCLPWLQTLLPAVLHLAPSMGPGGALRLRIVDASVLTQPGSRGTDYRLHLSWDLGQARIAGAEVTDAKGGETLVRYPVQPGEITLADRGYAHPRGLGKLLGDGGQAVVRIHFQNLPLWAENDQPLAVVAWLRTLDPTEPAERAAWVRTPSGAFRLRLLARPLSAQAAEAARRRLRQQARKRGRTPDKTSLDAAGYLTVVSNLDPTIWSAEQVLQLYRCRWQVELSFKRLKGLLDLDALRARTSTLAQVYLLGKLLGAALIERTRPTQTQPVDQWLAATDRPISLWRWFAWWVVAVRTAVRGPLTLTQLEAALPQLGRYFCDRPRPRRQQAAWARLLAHTGPPGPENIHSTFPSVLACA